MDKKKTKLVLMTVSVHQAQTQLSKLLDLLEEGEEVLIERHGRPVARLVRAKSAAKPRLGAMQGEFSWKEGWDRALPSDQADALGGALVAGPYLLDTSTLIWSLASPDRRSPLARRALKTGPPVLSVVGYWKAVIKARKGLLTVADPVNWWSRATSSPGRRDPFHPEALAPVRCPFLRRFDTATQTVH
jgi:prevent-host-death family protein